MHRRHPGVVAAAVCLAVAIVTLWPSLRPGHTLVAADLLRLSAPYSHTPGGRPHNPIISDPPYQFYPWLSFVAESLRHGHVPEWNPRMLGGVPVTPNGFVSAYYPPTWLAAVFRPLTAYNLFVLLHLVAGALGVYALSRTVGARPLAAGIVGLSALGAAFWVHWSMHLVHLVSFVLLPWALAALHRLVEASSWRRIAALAAVYGLWWLGGNPQFVYDGSLLVLAYGAALVVARRVSGGGAVVRPALGATVALGLGLMLAAPVLLATARQSGHVLRVREAAPRSGDHVPLSETIRAVVPDATGSPPDNVFFGSNDELRMDSPFVGVAALVLGGAALVGVRKADPSRLVLLAAVAAVVVLAYTSPPHELLHAVLPGYDRFRAVPPRWLSVLPAVALPLAALGLDDLLAGGARARRALVSGGAVGALATVAVAGWLLWERSRAGAPMRFFAGRAALGVALVALSTLAVWLIGRGRRGALGLAVLAGCVLVDVGLTTARWYPSVKERSAYPRVPVAQVARARGGRLVRVGPRSVFPPFAPDLPMAYGASDVEGLTPLLPPDIDRYLRLVDDYGTYALTLNVIPPLGDARALASPLLDALDVRTVVADPSVAVPGDYPLLDSGDPRVHARPSPGPAAVVPSAAPVTAAEAWRRVAAPDWDPTSTAAVVGLGRMVDGGPGRVSGASRGPGRERWDVDAPSGGFLRVSGRWDDGWSARIDGRSAEVLRADAIFRGVVVPPGRHRVDFSYRNPAEHRGRLVAGAALVVIVGLAFFGRRRATA